MRVKKHQSGLTLITWLFVMAIGGFFVLLTLKLVPIYLEYQSVRTVIQSLDHDPLVRKESAQGVRKIITKRLKINSVYDFPKEYIKIKKTKNRLTVDVTYDRIEPVIANISVMVSFSEKLNIEILP